MFYQEFELLQTNFVILTKLGSTKHTDILNTVSEDPSILHYSLTKYAKMNGKRGCIYGVQKDAYNDDT